MYVSLVIPARNAAATLPSTIESVLSGTRLPEEILVVDGRSADRTREVLEPYPVRVVHNPLRHVAAGRQLGVELAGGHIVAFTDADCIVDNMWLERLVERFEADPLLDGVGGRVTLDEPQTRVQAYSAHVFESIMQFPEEAVVLSGRRMSGSFPGANCAFRRDSVLSVGGFSQFFSNHAEEVDLCWRLLAAGAKLMFEPQAIVLHLGYPATVRSMVRTNFSYGIASTKLAKRHVGWQVDVTLWRRLGASVLCCLRPGCHDEWAGLRVIQMSAFVVGKVASSIRYGTINL